MGAAVVQVVSYCLQCMGAVCLVLARLVEMARSGFEVFTRAVTCGQGWQGLFMNFLTIFNSEEDPDRKDFHLPDAENRHATDLPVFIVFASVLIGMLAAMNRAIAYGRPEIYYQGIDSWGNVCGQPNDPVEGGIFSGSDMTKFDKVLVFDFLSRTSLLANADSETMATITPTAILCVEMCPLVTRTFNCWEFLEGGSVYPKILLDPICQSAGRELAAIKMQSLSFAEKNSRCVPDVVAKTVSVDKQNEMMALYSAHWIHNIIADCGTCAAELTWLTLIAAAFTMIFVGVIQGSTDSICLFSFAAFTIVGFLATCYSWYLYNVIGAEDNEALEQNAQGDLANFTGARMNGRQNPWGRADGATEVPQAGYSVVFRDACILVTFFTIFFTVISCLVGTRNVDAATALYSEAVAAMMQLRWIYMLPFLTLASICFSAGLFFHTINLLTAVFVDEPKIVNDPMYNSPTVVIDEDTGYTNGVLFFEVLAYTWVFNFIITCQILITNGAVATWYFTKAKEDMEKPMRLASSRLMRYHLGSAAAGGCMVGFFGWMRAPFSFCQSRLNRLVMEEEARLEEAGSNAENDDGDEGEGSGESQSEAPTNVPEASKGPSQYSNSSPPSASSQVSQQSDDSAEDGEKSPAAKNQGPLIPIEYLRMMARGCVPGFWFLNNFLVYISDLNLCMVAVKGISYFSAGYAIRTILQEDPKLKGLGAVSSYCMFLGKITVTVSVLPFGFLLLRNKEGVYVYGYPLALGALIAYIVAHIFLSLFNASVGCYWVANGAWNKIGDCRTVLMCYMEDRALNDGTEDAPYFGSPMLFKTFQKVLSDDEEEGEAMKTFRHAAEFAQPRPKKAITGDSDESISAQTPRTKQPKKKGDLGDHSSHFLLMPKKDKEGAKGTSKKDNKTKGKKKQRPGAESESYSSQSDDTRPSSRRTQRRGEYSSGESDNMFGNLFKEGADRDGGRDEDDDDDDDDGGDDDFDGGEKQKKKDKKGDKDKKKKKGDEKDKNKKGEKGKDKDKKGKEQEKGKKGDEKDKGKKGKKDEAKKKGKDPKKDSKTEKGADKKGKEKMDSKKKDGTKTGKKDKTAKADKKPKDGGKDVNKPGKKSPTKAKPTKADKKPAKDKPGGKIKGKGSKNTPKSGKSGKIGKKTPKAGKTKGKLGKPNVGNVKGAKPGKMNVKGGKMKGMKMGKAKGGKLGKLKGTKMGKLKGGKMGKMKGMKMGKLKGGKMGKLKGGKMGKFKGGKMGKMKGMKMGKMKAPKMKAPKMGKMRGPKMGGGGRKMAGGPGKMKGGGGRGMGGAGKMKGGKMAKMGKGLGMAGAVAGGAEGAMNIGNAMLRITGKKEQFNEGVEKAAFGTRKRAKATTALQHVMGGGGKGVFGAMKDVDRQFDEMEKEEKRERKRQKKQAKKEKKNTQKLLEKRLRERSKR